MKSTGYNTSQDLRLMHLKSQAGKKCEMNLTGKEARLESRQRANSQMKSSRKGANSHPCQVHCHRNFWVFKHVNRMFRPKLCTTDSHGSFPRVHYVSTIAIHNCHFRRICGLHAPADDEAGKAFGVRSSLITCHREPSPSEFKPGSGCSV